ncbi:hypothetical protein CPB86DRAFT_145599 [Serendipita vermifera]|nr:hypothetical protein CPB86DRAFT_145599 [Serendipita vermifera]
MIQIGYYVSEVRYQEFMENTLMPFPSDPTVKLATQEGSSLKNITRLILEIKVDSHVVGEANLLSRDSTPGIWDTDLLLFSCEVTGEFLVSVSMQVDENERQLLGSIELNGSELYDIIGNQYEVPLMCHENFPNLILQTKILGIKTVGPNGEDVVDKMLREGITAWRDFEKHGNLQGLELSISKLEAALKMTPWNLFQLPEILSRLGESLRCRFEQHGCLADINDSVERLEAAVNMTTDSEPHRPSYLENLGKSLAVRFNRLGDLADIDNAVTYLRAAVKLIPDGNPHKPGPLTNLGGFLLTRFERIEIPADVDGAVTYLQAAVSLTPDGDPYKPHRLCNLGSCLTIRFKLIGNIADLDSAIAYQQEAVNLTPDGHLNKPHYLYNLGCSLMSRFNRSQSIDDLTESINRHQTAVNLIPDGHPV